MNKKSLQNEAKDLGSYVKRKRETTVIAGGIVAIATIAGYIMGSLKRRGTEKTK